MVLVTCGFWVSASKPAAKLAEKVVTKLCVSRGSPCFPPVMFFVQNRWRDSMCEYSQDLLLAGRTNNIPATETSIIPLALAAGGASLAAAGAWVLWLIWAESRRVGGVMWVSRGCVRGAEL